jgi:hypothetical protein
MKRLLRLCVGALFAASGVAHAGGTAKPWDEHVIKEHVDETKLQGGLNKDALDALRQHGEELFTGRFTGADGVGRPLATQAIIPTRRKHPPQVLFNRTHGDDANACSGCHNQPATGGAGDIVTNVFVSEGFESAEFDSTDPQFSNERGTNHLFGAGLVELLSREMTAELKAIRAKAIAEAHRTSRPVVAELTTKGVDFGKVTAMPDGVVDLSAVDGVDADLVVRPFSQKGVMTSIRQFTINALNQHHGMEADERFGPRWTGSRDFDGDGVGDEISDGDVSALVAFQAMLAPPVQKQPDDPNWKAAATRGQVVFTSLGCAECHRPSLPLGSLAFADPGPDDMAGTLRTSDVRQPAIYDLALLDWAKQLPRNEKGEVLVPLFGDLKRHKIADQEVATLGNELLAQRFVERDVFMTGELWGVASTAPYGHRNDLPSLDAVIRAHGGEGRKARDAYAALPDPDREALIAFLRTLVIEP